MPIDTPLTPVGDETTVNTHTTGNQNSAKLEPLAGGGYVATWMSPDNSIRGQLFDADGAKLGSEFTITTQGLYSSFGNPDRYDLVAQQDGGFAVVWETLEAVLLQLYDSDGTPSGAQVVVSPNVSAGSPELTELVNGTLAVTYGDGGDLTKLYTAEGAPIGGAIDTGPVIAALAGGGFATAWTVGTASPFGNESDPLDVMAQVFDADGTAVTGEFLVNTSTANRQTLTSIAAFDNGNFIVVYDDYSQHPMDRGDVRAQIFTPSGDPFGNEIEIPGGGAGETGHQLFGKAYPVPGGMAIVWIDNFRADSVRALFIRNDGAIVADDIALGDGTPTDLTVLDNGQIAVTWFGYDVYLQLFSADFAKLGDVFNVTSGTPDTVESNAVVASGADGRLFVLWEANDANGRGLEAQLFAPLPPGTAGDDHLVGTPGDDALDGLEGADTMEGGLGNDTYYVDNPGDRPVEHVGEGIDTVYASVTYALPTDAEIEYLRVDPDTAGAINLFGNDFAQGIYGNDAANVLFGGGGPDLMAGGAGDDTYYVDSVGQSSDTVVEEVGGGNDRVAAATTFFLHAGAVVETLEALNLSGTERLDLSGNEFGQLIAGNNGVNVIYGFAGDDTLHGYGGDDYLVGGEGEDALYGGLGNDTYYLLSAADASLDHLFENAGEGTDRISTTVSYTLAAGLSIEVLEVLDSTSRNAMDLTGNELDNVVAGNADINVLRGGAGNDTLAGYDGNDHLYGDAGDDVLNAGGGADLMVGGSGADKYYVDDAGDSVHEAVGEGYDTVAASISYTLAAGKEIERLEPITFGSTAALDFTGNEFANYVIGNNGSNVLNGGLGADTFEGLGGADYFLFNTALGAGNVDRINDYLSSFDRFMLDDAVFTGLTPGALPAGAFNTGAGATDADDRILYDSTTGAVYFDADGTGATAAIQFATIGTGITMSSVDFLIV